jgi:hypothetical protein
MSHLGVILSSTVNFAVGIDADAAKPRKRMRMMMVVNWPQESRLNSERVAIGDELHYVLVSSLKDRCV